MPFTGDLSLAPLFLKLDVAGVLRLAFLPALLTLVIMGLLDTLGTLVGARARPAACSTRRAASPRSRSR